MKKMFFALFALTFLVSCTDNDSDSANNANNEETQKYLTSMIIEENGDSKLITFQYDENKNLKAYLEDGDLAYTFTYNDNNELVSVTDASGNSSVEIQYTNGVFSGYTTQDGEWWPVPYNEETKKYLFGEFGEQIGLEGRDIASVADGSGQDYLIIDYFDVHKGPMYNVPSKDIFLVNMFTDLYLVTSTKPISGIYDQGQNYSTESTYDQDDFITKMTLKSGFETAVVVTFQYSEL